MKTQERLEEISKRLKELQSPLAKMEYIKEKERAIKQELTVEEVMKIRQELSDRAKGIEDEISKEVERESIRQEMLESTIVANPILNFLSSELVNVKKQIENIKHQEVKNPEQEKQRISHAKQMMLLDQLGIIDYLNNYNLTNEKKSLLISLITGKNEQNTREYLIYGDGLNPKMPPVKNRYIYKTQENIDFVTKLLTKLNIF